MLGKKLRRNRVKRLYLKVSYELVEFYTVQIDFKPSVLGAQHTTLSRC